MPILSKQPMKLQNLKVTIYIYIYIDLWIVPKIQSPSDNPWSNLNKSFGSTMFMDSGITLSSVNRAAHFKVSQHRWRCATGPQKKFKLQYPNSEFVNFQVRSWRKCFPLHHNSMFSITQVHVRQTHQSMYWASHRKPSP